MRLLINEALEWPSFMDVENEPLAYALEGEPVTEPVSSCSPAARARSISVPAFAAHKNAQALGVGDGAGVGAAAVAQATATATAKLSTASASAWASALGASGDGGGSAPGTGKVQRMVEFIFDRLEMRFADTPLLVRYALCYITLSHYGR